MKKSNKILAVVLALVMILTAVPMMTAGAAEEEKHEHVYVQQGETVEPTCVTKGFTVYACECGDTKTTYTDALGHDLIGTYTVGELTHTKYCDRCKVQVPETHNWDTENATVKTVATCSATGKAEEKCKECGKTREVTIPMVAHTYSSVVADTLIEGVPLTHSGVCTVCNATKAEFHKWDDGVVTTKPQCAADGVKTYTCTVCKATKTEVIPATHTLPEKAKTFDDAQHIYTCEVAGCGYSVKANHKFVVVVGEKSVCDDSVALTITCEDCDYKLETKATQHDLGDVKVVNGKHEQVCKNCEKTFVTDHDWGEGKVTLAPTCFKEGVKTFTCACGQTKTEAIAMVEHTMGEWEVTKEATYTEKGEKVRVCTAKGCEYKETEEIAKLEYKVGDVNGDGKVGAVDARLILQHVANTRELSEDELARADIVGNGDGVKATDARKVLQIVAGLED
ncbi:MAG: dockerin type I repeat-containing protein [Clostridia bacterium]|nr:dockerin type I repeat-containing protein [Clostridia bacterium]